MSDDEKPQTAKDDGKNKRTKMKSKPRKIVDEHHLYDKSLDGVLAGIRPAPIVFGLNDLDVEDEDEAAVPEEQTSIIPDAKSCSTCGAKFESLEEQRQHYKMDWHRYNLVQRLDGHGAVTEEAFEKLIENLDNLSLSGSGSDDDDDDDESDSDSNSDDDGGRRELVAVPEAVDGEDDNDENEEAPGKMRRERHPWVFFENADHQLYSVYKCVLADKRSDLGDSEMIKLIPKLASPDLRWAVFMLGGGHFAGAVFRGGEAVLHKTFHCYTVRAGQGGSQSASDNSRGHAKSAGASLRRYNEQALVQHVQDIVREWSDELAKCSVIFYRAASGNVKVLFGGKEPPLSRKDARLRPIPFPTKRATFNEVKRVHHLLSSIRCHGDGADMEADMKVGRKKGKGGGGAQIRRSKSREERHRKLPDFVQELADRSSPSEDEDDHSLQQSVTSTDHLREFSNTPVRRKKKQPKQVAVESAPPIDGDLNQLRNTFVTACKSGNVPLLKECLAEASTSDKTTVSALLNVERFGSNRLAALHLASDSGKRDAVALLLDHGADPTIRDKVKKVPFSACLNTETRNAYRRFVATNPDRWDYKAAMIPPPLSEEEEQRQREKKRKQRDKKKEKEKEKKDQEKEVKEIQVEKDRFLALSDREKRALAAERRLLSTTASDIVLLRCFQCGLNISGKVPFEYQQYKFCTVKCLKAHRNKGAT
jgi:hypothetical protein